MEIYWVWFILAAILATAEMIGTDFFLLFLAASAVLTGLADFAFQLPFRYDVAIFCVLALCSVSIWFWRHRGVRNDTSDYVPNSGLGIQPGMTAKVLNLESDGAIRISFKDSSILACAEDARQEFAKGDFVVISGIAPNGRPVIKKG